MGGSSKKQTVGYKYYLGMHMALCHGVIDSVKRIVVGDKEAFLGDETGTSLTIDEPDLFGGEGREGGIQSTIDIAKGESTQGVNSYLSGQLGANTPAFRGVAAAILRQSYLGMNPYLKAWAFKLQRIHKTSGGATQWYDAKSAIGAYSIDGTPITFTEDFTTDNYTYTNPSKIQIRPHNGGFYMWTQNEGSVIARANREIPAGYYTSISFKYQNTILGNDDPGIFSFESSSQSIIKLYPAREKDIDPLRRPLILGEYASDTALEVGALIRVEVQLDWDSGLGSCQLYDGDTLVGGVTNAYFPNNAPISRINFVNQLNDGTEVGETYWGEIVLTSTSDTNFNDMNPAHIIREALTDTNWGMGYPEADIDDTAFTAAADTLYSEGMGISILWDRQNTIEAFVGEILRHIDATLYMDRTTGKFVLKLIRNDYDENTILTLGEDEIISIDTFSRPTIGELTNSVTVTYMNGTDDTQASVTVQDQALISQQGSVVSTTNEYYGFTNQVNASKVALRDLKALSTPLISMKLTATRSAAELNVGDVFKLTWPDFNIVGVVMRVKMIDFGSGTDHAVTIECVQDAYDTPDVGTVADQPSLWTTIEVDPTAPDAQLSIEAPYYELVLNYGESNVISSLGANNDLGYVLTAASAPPSAINAEVYADAGAGYAQVTALDFCPTATLASDVGRLTTTLSYSSGNLMDEVDVGSVVQVGDELMRVDAITATTITVGRGVLDTIPAAHTTGAQIIFWGSSAAIDPTEYVAGETIDCKVLPTTTGGVLSLAEATATTATLDSRAYRPYRPANVNVDLDNDPLPTYRPTYPVALAWAERNRLQETAGVILGWEDGTITPESGVTYKLVVTGYEGDGVTPSGYTETITGLTGTTYSYDNTNMLAHTPKSIFVDVQFVATRDGYDSLYSASLTFRGDYDLVLTEAGDLLFMEDGGVLILE